MDLQNLQESWYPTLATKTRTSQGWGTRLPENASIPSGAKARLDFGGLMYGLKPVPFT
jgi:hypothetical protein